MGPLMLVNWRNVNIRFTALMWVVALVLALAIVVSMAPAHKPSHSSPRVSALSSAALNGRP